MDGIGGIDPKNTAQSGTTDKPVASATQGQPTSPASSMFTALLGTAGMKFSASVAGMVDTVNTILPKRDKGAEAPLPEAPVREDVRADQPEAPARERDEKVERTDTTEETAEEEQQTTADDSDSDNDADTSGSGEEKADTEGKNAGDQSAAVQAQVAQVAQVAVAQIVQSSKSDGTTANARTAAQAVTAETGANQQGLQAKTDKGPVTQQAAQKVATEGANQNAKAANAAQGVTKTASVSQGAAKAEAAQTANRPAEQAATTAQVTTDKVDAKAASAQNTGNKQSAATTQQIQTTQQQNTQAQQQTAKTPEAARQAQDLSQRLGPQEQVQVKVQVADKGGRDVASRAELGAEGPRASQLFSDEPSRFNRFVGYQGDANKASTANGGQGTQTTMPQNPVAQAAVQQAAPQQQNNRNGNSQNGADAARPAEPAGRETQARAAQVVTPTTQAETGARAGGQGAALQTAASTPFSAPSQASGAQNSPHSAPTAQAAPTPQQSADPEQVRKMTDQIRVNIAKDIKKGMDRISIQLRPENLGRVDVRLELSEQNRVTAQIVVEKPETLETLRSDIRSLERALQDAGLKTDASSMELSLRENGFTGFDSDRFAGKGGGNGGADGSGRGAEQGEPELSDAEIEAAARAEQAAQVEARGGVVRWA